MPPGESTTLPPSLWWLAFAWLFVFGACVGSFLNVVIYRLPAGLSLLYPGSRCPKCATPIRATDNVPIFSWLWLSGRCRTCHAAISPRYPAVELAVAALFAALAALELLSGGANLPAAGEGSRFPWNQESLLAVYGYHLALLCGLLCAALIEYDGHRLPWRLNVTLICVGIGVLLVWPEVRPVSSGWSIGFLTWLGPNETAVLDGATGLVAALLLACAAYPATRLGPGGRLDWQCSLATSVWVGFYLGWQATCALAVLSAATRLAVVLGARVRRLSPRLAWNGCLGVWTLVWIIGWKSIDVRCPFVGGQADGWTLLAAVAVTAVLSAMTWTIGRRWAERADHH